ncbi:RNA polymerase I-specific transcription initiation factor rrn11 [Vanrija pseudolonga]|uniref:RNA polymerase I-specific transcription initiation factor rrn11 n=1 Tax=Vanrija pseudolonga TaxID=143232 RepID=A0AAF0Y284_9TREE|nr:RNA polymerase I-specific transcription initiation factor rrn11 [Vanrija pseudolonga]
MVGKYKFNPEPNGPDRPRTVRGAYIYNLVDCIYACILRGELDRARRAWGILVRCPDVNWKERWRWGLYLMTAETDAEAPAGTQTQTQTQQPKEVERWLKSLQISMPEGDRPAILAELVLFHIKGHRYRAALDELETYLTSYPYLLSASLHTYAGMICFYLAQPKALQGSEYVPQERAERRDREVSVESSSTATSVDSIGRNVPPPNEGLLRQARKWFEAALKINPREQVALGFIGLMENPDTRPDYADDKSDEEMELELQSMDSKSDAGTDKGSESDSRTATPERYGAYGGFRGRHYDDSD